MAEFNFNGANPTGLGYAADNHNTVASGGLFDATVNLVTEGVPAIGASIISNLVNIPVDLANIPYKLATGDSIGDNYRLTTSDLLTKLDSSLGSNIDSYYLQHKEGIDMGGYVASSLVPGLIGAKALRAALGTASKLENGSNLGKAMGLVDTLGQSAVTTAKAEIVAGTPFSYISAQALKATTAGAVNGVLDTLAFNTAATLALHRSPYLDGKSGWDLTKDAVTDSLIFGAATGAVFDFYGKGVGLLGLRAAVKGETETVAKIMKLADDINPRDFGGTIKTGSPLKDVVSLAGVQQSVPGGDIVTFLKMQIDDVAVKMKAGPELEALLSTNPTLRTAELNLFETSRTRSVERLTTKMESAVLKLLPDELVGLERGDLVKQMLAGTTEQAAQLFAGAEKFYRPSLTDMTKAMLGVDPKLAILDLKSGTIVSNAKGFSVFDLNEKASELVIAAAKKNPAVFNLRELASGELNGITGSANYKVADAALAKVTNMDNYVTVIGKQPQSFIADFVKLDLVVNRATKLDATLIVDGKVTTVGVLKDRIAVYKSDLVNQGIILGKSEEELAAILHLDSASILRPNAGEFTLTEVPKPRYILGDYNINLRNPNSTTKFGQEALIEARGRAKLAEEELAISLQTFAADLMPGSTFAGYIGGVSNAAGLIKAADADFGNVFQQRQGFFTKLYDSVLRNRAKDRISPIDSAAQAIVAGGKLTPEYTETAALFNWITGAKQKGGGVVRWIDDAGETYFLHKELITSTQAVQAKEVRELKKLKTLTPDQQVRVGMKTSDYLNERFGTILADPSRHMYGPDNQIIKLNTPELKNYVEANIKADQRSLAITNELRRVNGENGINVVDDAASGLAQFYSPTASKVNSPYVMVIKADVNHQNPNLRGSVYVQQYASEKELVAARQKLTEEGLKTYTKTETKDFYAGIELYDNALSLDGRPLKNAIESKGKLTTFLPGEEATDEGLKRFRDFNIRNEFALTRAQISLKHSQDFASLRAISYEQAATRDSRFASGHSIGDLLRKDAPTEADKTINQLLHIQNSGTLNSFTRTVDKALNSGFDGALNLFKKAADKITPEDELKLAANMKSLGIEESYGEAIRLALNKPAGSSNSFDSTVRFTNSLLATGQLRLDFLNPLVNVIGAPVLGGSVIGLAIKDIKNRVAMAGGAKAVADFEKVLGVNEGGLMGNSVNFVKLAHKSVGRDTLLAKDTLLSSIAKDSTETVGQLYLRLGITANPSAVVTQELNNSVINMVQTNSLTSSSVKSVGNKVFGALTKLSDMAEGHLQFMAADAGLQIATAAKLNVIDTLSLMNTITQKLQGNFTASQKPQIFQGTVGAAIGLFQSYQARVVHRILDVIDSGDKRMLMEMSAMQAGVFGTKSMPFFDAMNKTLIADNNANRQDAYSGVFGAVDRRAAETMMYGIGSSLLGLNLSTRGAMDFRAPSSFETIPAVSLWAQQIKQVKDFASAAANGASISQELNHAIQHNVFNRPLQQLAIFASDQATTMAGKESINPMDEKWKNPTSWMNHSVTQSMRMLGARPIDEAVYLDGVYRYNNFRLADREKNVELWRAVGSNFAGDNNQLTESQVASFKKKFFANGGTENGFNAGLKAQYNSMNKDAGERLRKSITNVQQREQADIIFGTSRMQEDIGSPEIVPDAGLGR